MAYRLKRKDDGVGNAVRRIADEQIGKALASIDSAQRAEAVHDVRKRCKKLRGLIRLVRPAFGGYSDENAAFRDTARMISGARDAKVMQDTYDLLMSDHDGSLDRTALGPIRRQFTMERKSRIEDGDVDDHLDEARERLVEARERAQSWTLDDDGWDAVAGGLKKTYGRAVDAAEKARDCPDGEQFHELRKRAKYHWYHCRLLENLWPDMMATRKHAAKQLSDILGDHHDLHVFAGRLAQDPDGFGSSADVEVAIGLARARQARLEAQAWPILNRMLVQQPKVLGQHFEALWNVWQKDG
ncbi:MAG: hypothetical protein CL820_05290 [Croceicoccus sp.]|nr:hypothetical protein [Croceicoccus sp.]MAL25304.1 hypothetical protein [Croceicoccus sp.]|tara:strand:+ start:12313 stop:13209 length:897 start_codon:yes stop_codon:yes gene_type:complete